MSEQVAAAIAKDSIFRRGVNIVTLRPVRERFHKTNWESFLVIWGPRSPWFLIGTMIFIAFARHLIVSPIAQSLGYDFRTTARVMYLLLLVVVLATFILYPAVQFGQVLARNVTDSSGKARDDNRSRTPGWALSIFLAFRLFVTGVYLIAGIDLKVWWFVAWSDWPEWLVLFGLVYGNLLIIEMKTWAYTRITARAFGLGDSGLTTDQARSAHAAGHVVEVDHVAGVTD